MTQKASITRLSERRSRSEPSPAGDASAGVQLVPHNLVRPSRLNPRKLFDPKELEDLATSIAAQDLLQTLVVRPDPEHPGHYELAAGEHRWRAVAILIKRGERPADTPVPIVVRPLTDEQLLTLGLAENIQRASMHPLEEAEAFLAFTLRAQRGEGATGELAQLLGKTQRWVQQRMALATKLAPETKEAFRNGLLSLEQAKAFLTGSQDQQRALLAEHTVSEDPDDDEEQYAEDPELDDDTSSIDGQPALPAINLPPAAEVPPTPVRLDIDPDRIRRTFVRDLPSVSRALFPLERYTGEVLGDEEELPTERYFADAGLFAHLQEQAIAEKEAELQLTHQVVDIERSGYFQSWQYHQAPEGKPTRAVIHVNSNGCVTIATGLALAPKARPEVTSSGAAKKSTPQEPCTKALYAEAHRRKTATLQDAIASDPKMALRLACLALLTPAHDAPHLVRLDSPPAIDQVLGAAVTKRLAALELPKDMRQSGQERSPRPQYSRLEGQGPKIWSLLLAMPQPEVEKLHAALIAAQFGSFSGFNPQLGDSPLLVAIAEALKLEHATNVALSDDWLEGYRRTRLDAVAKASKSVSGEEAKDLGRMTGKTLRAAILTSKTRDPKYVPPELFFGSEKELKQRVNQPKPKAAAKTKAAKKTKAS